MQRGGEVFWKELNMNGRLKKTPGYKKEMPFFSVFQPGMSGFATSTNMADSSASKVVHHLFPPKFLLVDDPFPLLLKFSVQIL